MTPPVWLEKVLAHNDSLSLDDARDRERLARAITAAMRRAQRARRRRRS